MLKIQLAGTNLTEIDNQIQEVTTQLEVSKCCEIYKYHLYFLNTSWFLVGVHSGGRPRIGLQSQRQTKLTLTLIVSLPLQLTQQNTINIHIKKNHYAQDSAKFLNASCSNVFNV